MSQPTPQHATNPSHRNPQAAAAAPHRLKPRVHDVPVLGVAATRRAEAQAYAGIPSFELMARAGQTAWLWANSLMQAPREAQHHAGLPWLILAGTGNNGGDAFVLARHAHAAGVAVQVHATGHCAASATDAARARTELEQAGVIVQTSATLTAIDPAAYACIVDGLLGIGIRSDPSGEAARLIRLVNAAHHPLTLSLDVPSGLDADSGLSLQPCLQATHTLSFIACKPGLLTADGPDCCGDLWIDTLGLTGLDTHPTDHLNDASTESGDKRADKSALWIAQSDRSLLAQWPSRILNSHKGQNGDVVIVGGDAGMTGAAVLAGRTAVQMGAGRVFLGLLDGPHPPGYDPVQPEIMLRNAESMEGHGGIWVIGPGAGQSERMQRLLQHLLRIWHDTPGKAPRGIVIDADALNLLAADPALAVRFQSLEVAKIITPHPLEAGRLLARSASAVQADRSDAALSLARQLDCTVVLKGQGTLISNGQSIAINLSGGPALASGGTGDVLAGCIGALMARLTSTPSANTAATQIDTAVQAAWIAATLGTYLHGATCDAIGAESAPPLLLTASDLPARMHAVLQRGGA